MSLPPTDMSLESLLRNVIFVTWLECPANDFFCALNDTHGYFNKLTLPKSSTLANNCLDLATQQAFMSVPSMAEFQIPMVFTDSVQVFVAHLMSLMSFWCSICLHVEACHTSTS